MDAKDSRDFYCYVPMGQEYLEKSLKEDKEDKDPQSWKIGGIASSNEVDLQEEIVEPEGLITDYFIKFGFYNYNHEKGPDAKIGIPLIAKTTSKGLYTSGYLLKEMPLAIETHRLMKTLAKGNHPRNIGFSIEGKVILQEGKRIIKSWIRDIAITPCPVNTFTYAELLKSLKTCSQDESLESMPDVPKIDK